MFHAYWSRRSPCGRWLFSFIALSLAFSLAACQNTGGSTPSPLESVCKASESSPELAQGSSMAGRLSGKVSLNKTSYGYSIVNDVSRAGQESQRFEVRAGDCSSDPGWSDCDNDRERSEISIKRRFNYGLDQWIGFSVFLPKNFKTSDKVHTTVGQIHQRGGPSGTAGGLPSFPPVVQLNMKSDEYSACVHILTGSPANVRDRCKTFDLASIENMRDRWTDIILHLDTSSNVSELEIFVNCKRKAQLLDFINFKPSKYYFKYGIYRSFVSRHGGAMPTQILYIDEVRMGNRISAVVVNTENPVD